MGWRWCQQTCLPAALSWRCCKSNLYLSCCLLSFRVCNVQFVCWIKENNKKKCQQRERVCASIMHEYILLPNRLFIFYWCETKKIMFIKGEIYETFINNLQNNNAGISATTICRCLKMARSPISPTWKTCECEKFVGIQWTSDVNSCYITNGECDTQLLRCWWCWSWWWWWYWQDDGN